MVEPETKLSQNTEARRLAVLVTDTLSVGGAERQMVLLVQGMINRGWAVTLWTLGDGPFRSVLQDAGADVIVVQRRWRWDFTPVLSLPRLIRSLNPSVVIARGWLSGLAALKICAVLRIPFVDGTIRNARPTPRRRLFRMLGLRKALVCIANTAAGLRAYGVRPERGRVVYNGFDMTRLDDLETRMRHNNTFTVCMTGRMVPARDYRTFLCAAADILAHSNLEPWRFLLIGDGPERAALEKIAARLLPPESFAIISPGTEVLPLVASCDVGVLLTDPRHASEGCSNALLEYMACALPVVCSDSGGNREVVEDGRSGLIVPGSDTQAVVRALLTLHANAILREQMGQEGRNRVINRFSVHAMVENTLRVVSELGVVGCDISDS